MLDEFPEIADCGLGEVTYSPNPCLPSESWIERLIDQTVTAPPDAAGPYLMYTIKRTLMATAWNPNYDREALCQCEHMYYRHFDTWEDMYPCGCKYCDCRVFQPIQS